MSTDSFVRDTKDLLCTIPPPTRATGGHGGGYQRTEVATPCYWSQGQSDSENHLWARTYFQSDDYPRGDPITPKSGALMERGSHVTDPILMKL